MLKELFVLPIMRGKGEKKTKNLTLHVIKYLVLHYPRLARTSDELSP